LEEERRIAAERQAELEAQLEAERKTRAEADKKAKAEADRKAKTEADRKAQTEARKNAEEEDDKIYIRVEKMPEFPGGNEELSKFLVRNIKYPLLAQENGIQGRVICQFIVNADGRIENIEVVRGVEESLDQEAIRVLKLMPNWEPGRQGGKNVSVKFTLGIRFKL
jgi:protein TonB